MGGVVTELPLSEISAGDYVPLDKFGRDHWSTLAYVETVMVECGGFQVGSDPHMRSGRRNWRVLREGCPKPKRPTRSSLANDLVMSREHGSRLSDGTYVPGHDDWHCIQDMVVLGFFDSDAEPGVTLRFLPLGQSVALALRQHKANGGTFASFTPPPERT